MHGGSNFGKIIIWNIRGAVSPLVLLRAKVKHTEFKLSIFYMLAPLK